MTIQSEIRRAGPFIGDGVAVDFPFAFKIFKTSDVFVQRAGATGAAAPLTIDSDYTVFKNANQDNQPGGMVRLKAALPVGSTLLITSAIPYLQELDITNQGAFYAQSVEDQLDYLTVLVQQLRGLVPGYVERVNRVLTYDRFGEPDPKLPGDLNTGGGTGGGGGGAGGTTGGLQPIQQQTTNITTNTQTVNLLNISPLATRITIQFARVIAETSAISNFEPTWAFFRLGVAGGIVTAGYDTQVFDYQRAKNPVSKFALGYVEELQYVRPDYGSAFSGSAVLSRVGTGNIWVLQGASTTYVAAGSVHLPSLLTSLVVYPAHISDPNNNYNLDESGPSNFVGGTISFLVE